MNKHFKQFLLLSIPLVALASYFMVHVRVGNFALIASLSMIVLALPAFLAVWTVLGKLYGTCVLAVLSVFAWAFESQSLVTYIPYGAFNYGELLGSKLFGLAPWTVPFGYIPLVIGAVIIAQLIVKHNNATLIQSIVTPAVYASIFLVLFDIVFDPSAVAMGFWSWENPGVYYGVPIVNFIGWFISSFIASSLLIMFQNNKTFPLWGVWSLWLSLLTWTFASAWLGLFIPTIIGALCAWALVSVICRRPTKL